MFYLTDNRYSACIASSLSIYYRAAYKWNKDVTWRTFDIQLFTWVFLPFPSLSSFRVTNYSCVEMFIGVICTCMPSFSKMLHHHDTQLHTFKMLCFSFFHDLRPTLTKSDGKAMSSEDASSQKKTSCQTLDLVPLHDVVVSTFIGSGQRIQVAEDVIHLMHEVEQREHKAGSRPRESL